MNHLFLVVRYISQSCFVLQIVSKRHFRPRCQVLNVYEVLLCFLEKYSNGPVMHFTCLVCVNTVYDFSTECYLTIAVIFTLSHM